MITINHSVKIEIEILNANAAIENEGILARIASKLPGLGDMVDRKVEEKIEKEIRKQLSVEILQRQIQQGLADKGVQASVLVS